jgi:hypothetical protein
MILVDDFLSIVLLGATKALRNILLFNFGELSSSSWGRKLSKQIYVNLIEWRENERKGKGKHVCARQRDRERRHKERQADREIRREKEQCRSLQDLGLHLVDLQYAVVVVLVVAGNCDDAPRWLPWYCESWRYQSAEENTSLHLWRTVVEQLRQKVVVQTDLRERWTHGENENERKGKRKHVCVRGIKKEIDREIDREIEREEAQRETDRQRRGGEEVQCRTWLCIWLICHCTHAPEPRALRLLRLRS